MSAFAFFRNVRFLVSTFSLWRIFGAAKGSPFFVLFLAPWLS
jgi:hypothetical protein